MVQMPTHYNAKNTVRQYKNGEKKSQSLTWHSQNEKRGKEKLNMN